MEKARLDFRIKVDLSKFFQDHRKISWIFVDSSTILYVKHLKEHIAKLFDIKEPFYLLCESTYLPFNEDIRIVRNDNFVTLVPGTLIDNSSNSIEGWPRANSIKETASQVSSAQASTFDEKEVQTDRDDHAISTNSLNGDVTAIIPSDDTVPDPTPTNTTVYHSILDESEVNSGTESRFTDSLLTEDNSMDMNTPAKRKRTRRKKLKRLSTDITNRQNTYQAEPKKAKIINSFTLASGKHIRFKGPDEEIVSQNSHPPDNFVFPKLYDTPEPKKTLLKGLDTLLALKQCSTPFTFSCKKVEKELKVDKEVKVEKASKSLTDEDEENLTESARNIVPNESKKIQKNSDLQIKDIDPENYPLFDEPPKVDDIFAFKLFKMEDDYTPHISKYIIGKVVAIHQITLLCTIKVLIGKPEIQLPKGKFTLPDEEAEPPSDVVKLNYNQLLEKRLISRNHE